VIHKFESALKAKNSQKETNLSAADMFYPCPYNFYKKVNINFLDVFRYD